jgi:hypothetical protein
VYQARLEVSGKSVKLLSSKTLKSVRSSSLSTSQQNSEYGQNMSREAERTIARPEWWSQLGGKVLLLDVLVDVPSSPCKALFQHAGTYSEGF